MNYDLWEMQGALLTTEGNVVHYGFIEKFIEELGTKYNIREIAFDRYGANSLKLQCHSGLVAKSGGAYDFSRKDRPTRAATGENYG